MHTLLPLAFGPFPRFESWELTIIAVGVLVTLSCSLLSVYVVLRRMAMISEGVSHAGFGGIGFALLLGYYVSVFDQEWMQQIVTGVFCLGTALAINFLTRSKRVHEDSAIGIFLVASVALGMVLIELRSRLGMASSVRPEQFLFGQFSAVGTQELVLAGISAAIVVTAISLFYNELLYTTLDEDMARVNGVNTRLINGMLLVLLSLVIVVGVRMVGFLMITALTILPGATANLISRRFGGVFIGSLLVGTLTALVTLPIVIKVDMISRLPPGPILVLALFAIFCVAWVIRHTFRPKVAPETTAPAEPPSHAH